MTITLEDLERRVAALEDARPADLRTAVTTMLALLRETRSRQDAADERLEAMRKNMVEMIAEQARTRGELSGKIDAVRTELKSDIAGLRRDLPGMIAETMREVLRETR